MFVTGLLFLVILVLLRQQRSSLLSLTLTGVYLRMGRRDPQGQMIRLSVSEEKLSQLRKGREQSSTMVARPWTR